MLDGAEATRLNDPRPRRSGARATAGLILAACVADTPTPPGTLVVVAEQQSAWVANFNPFFPAGVSRWPSGFGVHEPLMVWSAPRQRHEPALATAWSWDDAALALVLELRDDVRWSDGEAFGPADVVFTFDLLRAHAALDRSQIRGFVERVEVAGAGVRVQFSKRYLPGITDVLQTPIVPAHRWREVADPVAFTNDPPVGTGPFTEKRTFDPQSWELGRNPFDDAGSASGVAALRFPVMLGNDAIAQGLARGEIDWAGAFVPQPQRVFVDGDPAHRSAWSPPTGGMVFLYLNHLDPALADPRVRRAVSAWIDRDRVVRVAMQGLTVPADASGVSDAMARWRDPEVACPWITFDPLAAEAWMIEAGFGRDPGGRWSRHGQPLEIEIQVVAGWSDQVRAARLVVDDLQRAGVQAHLRTLDFAAWFDRLQRGTFSGSFGWSLEGPTPYIYWRSLLSERAKQPVGEPAQLNWQRSGDPRADALLTALSEARDDAAALTAAFGLHRLFCEVAPAVPLYPNPAWGEASTARFVGFPSEDDPYARLSPNHPPEPLLVLRRLRAR
jgi:peptide/nickel transport system substrate-binding protein